MVSFVDCRGDGVEFMNVSGSFLKVRTKDLAIICNGVRILKKNNTQGCA